MLEYTISAAAVARGWTSYAATLVGLPSNAFRIGAGSVQLDILAALNVFAQSAVLCVGIRESANFNLVVTGVNLACVAFVLLAGAGEVDTANYTPFNPYGVSGGASRLAAAACAFALTRRACAVFTGASVVFFAFVGFDSLACCAEARTCPPTTHITF